MERYTAEYSSKHKRFVWSFEKTVDDVIDTRITAEVTVVNEEVSARIITREGCYVVVASDLAGLPQARTFCDKIVEAKGLFNFAKAL